MRPIRIKPSHKGLLHKEMGVPQGKSLSLGDLEKAKRSASPAERKRIVFAQNAKSWNR